MIEEWKTTLFRLLTARSRPVTLPPSDSDGAGRVLGASESRRVVQGGAQTVEFHS